jgi:TonB family protein
MGQIRTINTVVLVLALAGAGCNKPAVSNVRSPVKPLVYQAVPPIVAAGSLLSSSSPNVRAAALDYAARDKPRQEAPFSLTASDGTGLHLERLSARTVLEGPLAFTELRLSFRNPQKRTIEGRFSITLPEKAAISRFAMRIRGAWMEAEVVERQAARQTYESFLHRKQDPALLEKKAGNAFRARVFPILPHEAKQLIVSYSQELASTRKPYRLPLKGLPRVGLLDITAQLEHGARSARSSSLGGEVSNRRVIRVSKRDWKPDQDFELGVPAAVAGLHHENLLVARVKPSVQARQRRLSGVLVLLDTSASRARGLAAQVEVLDGLVRELARSQGGDLPLKVVCFDQTVTPVFEGKVSQLGEHPRRRILARRALGASNIAGALAWARRVKGYPRLLLVTDGVPTAGARDGASLRLAVSELSKQVQRLDVLLVGGIRDEALMRRLTAGTLKRDGVVLDGDLPSAELARRLTLDAVSGVEVQIPGARWVWPSVLDGIQPGDEVLVFGDLPPKARPRQGRITVKLSGRIGIQEHEARVRPAEQPLLERACVQARIHRLEHRRDTLGKGDPDVAGAVKRQITALSTRHRVLSDHTALLVLETERDYRRFKIDRKALADILVVGSDGVTLKRRTSLPSGVASGVQKGGDALGALSSSSGSHHASIFGRDTALGADAEDALGGLIGNQIGEAYGVGGLGLVGTGRGGDSAGQRHEGEEGKMGSRSARRRTGLYGLRGPRNNPDPHLARRLADDAAKDSGVLGNLGTIGRGGGGSGFVGMGRGTGRLRGLRARAPLVVAGRPAVRGSLSKEIIRRIIRRHINEVRYCYQVELQANPDLYGRVIVRFVIQPNGQVATARVASSTMNNRRVERCIAQAVRRWLFPKPRGGGIVIVSYPFVLHSTGGAIARAPQRRSKPPAVRSARVAITPPRRARPAATSPQRLLKVQELLRAGEVTRALTRALRWRAKEPGDILALLALGRSLRAAGHPMMAARAYGSIIDLYPSRADMRRFAGQQLEALGRASLMTAEDTYSVAVEQRPDHPVGFRLLAHALLRRGEAERAYEVLEKGLASRFPAGRFPGIRRVLLEDLGLAAAVWIRKAPRRKAAIERRTRRNGAVVARSPSLRFVLHWETDANDVDLHVRDARGGHAFHAARRLRSGGMLYHDVTNGYGPECFAIKGAPAAYPYRLSVHYFSRGPMGYGMGTVQVIQHDGKGRLRYSARPFVATRARQTVKLGPVKRL